MALRRRRQLALSRRSIDKPTAVLGVVALATTGVALAGEVAHVWRRGSAPGPTEAPRLLTAAEEAARETVEVVREGYRHVSTEENALLNLLGSFTLTFANVRAITYLIRTRGRAGPLRNIVLGRRHIHHFIPGIAMCLLAGGTSIVSPTRSLDRWLAVPFGVGAALTLDESALLLELDDVYWTDRGVVSVQITLGTMALLASLALALRMLRQGESVVLDPPARRATDRPGPADPN